jgi:hypothetical protein
MHRRIIGLGEKRLLAWHDGMRDMEIVGRQAADDMGNRLGSLAAFPALR